MNTLIGRKRKRVNRRKEAPFPVPIASISGQPASNRNWKHYKGELSGTSVIIKNSEEMDLLYRMGFFGKGTLSRGGVETICQEQEPANRRLRMISKRRYLRRVKWAKQKEEQGGQLTVGDISESESSSMEMEDKEISERTDSPEIKKMKQSDPAEIMKGSGDNYCENKVSEKSDTGSNWEVSEKESDNFWSCDPKDENEAEDPWSCDMKNETESADFWTTEKETNDPWADECDNKKEVEDFWGVSDTTKNASSVTDDKIKQDDPWTNEKGSGSWTCNKEPPRSSKESELVLNTENSESIVIDQNQQSTSETSKTDTSTSKNVTQTKGADKASENMDKKESDELENLTQYDPRSQTDDENGDLFVIDDSDDEQNSEVAIATKLPWKPCRKVDPYKVHEYLQLSFEEAFFLSYGLGCLIVEDEDKSPMNLTQMWQTFSARQPCFIPNYIAYHSFRSRGWVPKTGLKFGGEFVIYKEGPPFYHSFFTVRVCMIDGATLTTDQKEQPWTWYSMAALNRVSSNIKKEMMLFYVIKPAGMKETELSSPNCIPQFKTQEILMKRWVSLHEREKGKSEEEEMP